MYGTPGDIKVTKTATDLNILAIIVLSESMDHFSNSPSQEGPEAFGVESIIESLGVEEDERERPEEPFL